GDPASGANNTSNLMSPTHVFTAPGDYSITITFEVEGETQILYRLLTIADEPPVLDLDPLSVCDVQDSTPINVNLNSIIPIDIQSTSDFNFSFFTSENDAISNTNPILTPLQYTITTNDTIFVRLNNANGNGCYSISQFEIILLNSPDIDDYEAVFFCDNGNSTVTIDVGNLPLPESHYSFEWSEDSQTSSHITVSGAGTYTVSITENTSITPENPDGCSAIRTVEVNSSSIATIEA